MTFADLPGPGQLVPEKMVRVLTAEPFGTRLTLPGLIDHVLQPGCGQAGGGEVVRSTVPEKFSTSVTGIAVVAVVPAGMARLL